MSHAASDHGRYNNTRNSNHVHLITTRTIQLYFRASYDNNLCPWNVPNVIVQYIRELVTYAQKTRLKGRYSFEKIQ